MDALIVSNKYIFILEVKNQEKVLIWITIS
ncbi:hypothetical protein [Halobacillus sp. Marseille-Q1614]